MVILKMFLPWSRGGSYGRDWKSGLCFDGKAVAKH